MFHFMSQDSDLNELFGPPLEPAYVRDAERQGQFSNTFALDPISGRYLNELLEFAGTYPTFRDLAINLCFLWAVDESGQIWITMEEVCLSTQLGKRFPRMRNMPLDGSLQALGHPLLVNRGVARIAGEMILDDDDSGNEDSWLHWVINNKSGRYGFGPYRVPGHLANVAAAFSGVGVTVENHYIEAR
jgi:hypothetical protein